MRSSYHNVKITWPVILPWLPRLFAAILFAILVSGATARSAPAAPTAAQDPTGAGCQPWTLVFPPNPRTHHYLRDIDALAPDDIWAVGEYYDDQNYTPDTALVMHWDGTQWTIMPTPPNAGRPSLNGVDAIAPDDVWAVGYCGGCAFSSLTMHWDGVQWTRIPSPDPPGYVQLNDVVALAPNNVWAVGANDGGHSTVVMNWDGTAWSIVPSPNGGMFGDDNVLTSVSAISSNDIWAVGYIYPKGGTPTTLTIHWNGGQWALVPSPNPGNYSRALYGVSTLASNDVWAVGSYSYNSGTTYLPLFLHWNGTQWQHVQSPEFPDYNVLRAVHAISPNDVWAVGTNATCDFCSFETLTMHWDGTAWTRVTSPNGFRDFSRLYGVTATSPGDIWAVGMTDDRAYPYTSDALTLHRVCSLGTPTATPTGAPPTSTFTRTSVPTYTPTPTQTVAATPTCNPNGLRILIVYADYQSPPLTLRNGMLAQSGVQVVDYVRADSTTPSLQQLLQYDVVVPFANATSWADSTTLGNRLADYQDAYGIVVAFNFSWSGPPRGISGRWQSGNYTPFGYGANIYSTGTLGTYNATHPLMAGVTNLSAYYRSNVVLNPGAEQVAAWNNSVPLIAVKGRAVGVSAYVGDEDGGWSGDFGRIVVNAGRWLRLNQCLTPVSTSTPSSPSATHTASVTHTPTPTATPGGPAYCTQPSFGSSAGYAVGDGPERLAVGDFNRDGSPDLAVANRTSNNISVLLGNSAGGLGTTTNYDISSAPSGIVVGDFNRDGNPDLAAASYGRNQAIVLLGNGSGAFGSPIGYLAGSGPSGIAMGDFNRDGNPDLVVSNGFADTMSVLMGNGSGGFSSPTNYNLDWIPVDVAVGDFNHDGNPDVAAANRMSDNISVRLGNGSGGFGAMATYDVGQNPSSIGVDDFNHDGNSDIATSSPDTGNISVLLSNGNGGFGTAINFPAGNGSASIGIGDFSLDGNLDLAAANVPGNVAVVLGNGLGGFGPFTNFGAGSGPKAVAVGDFNSDGRSDLAVTNNTGDNVSVLLNTCPAVVATPTGTPGAVLVGHVAWQGRPAQPNPLQQLPVTLTLKLGTTEVNYSAQTTSASGSFTVSVGGMSPGAYAWRAKGPKYLSNSGTVQLTGSPLTGVEMGLMRTGDCNNDDIVNVADFNILKVTFGKGDGDPGYDDRADFNGDRTVNVTDFNLLKVTFGQGGAPPISPGG